MSLATEHRFSRWPSSRSSAAVAALLVGLGGCGSIRAIAADAGGGSGGTSGAGGSGADAGTPADGPRDVNVTIAEACSQEANAICDALHNCADFAVQVFYGDRDTCVARQLLGCMTDQAVTGTTRTTTDILACGDAVHNALCPDLLAAKFPDVCLVKPGTVINGMACGSDWQCQSTYCRKSGQCGVCGARAGVGGACTADDACQTGMVCAAGNCQVPVDLGGICGNAHPCRSGLYCTMAVAGTCATKVGVGGSCADSGQACDLLQGAWCNTLNNTCQMGSVAKGGDMCGIVSGVLTVCVGLNPCPGVTLLRPIGVCANPAADGAPCGAAANGINCVGPASCDMGVCRLPSASSCN